MGTGRRAAAASGWPGRPAGGVHELRLLEHRAQLGREIARLLPVIAAEADARPNFAAKVGSEGVERAGGEALIEALREFGIEAQPDVRRADFDHPDRWRRPVDARAPVDDGVVAREDRFHDGNNRLAQEGHSRYETSVTKWRLF